MNRKPNLELKGARIVVTGGAGFLGSHLVEQLSKEKPREIIVPRSNEFDLRKESVAKKLFKNADIVIHLAANVGGIGYNRDHPAELFYDNMLLGVNTMHAAWKMGVKKFIALGTICAYPKYTPIPFKESDLWMGYPEETNAPYGLAKKMLLVQAQAYRKQYGFSAIYLLPTNLYGPRDNFDPKASHVIPALIKKFIEAKNQNKPEVTVWGTGTPTREFLYVEDAARGIILATKFYDHEEPVNLGSNFEISISELAHLIGDLVEYKGKIIFDVQQPDGQPRRKIDTTRAKLEFGFESKINFEEGLKQTIKWYTQYGK
jgi:GDP-L-fucose synthase